MWDDANGLVRARIVAPPITTGVETNLDPANWWDRLIARTRAYMEAKTTYEESLSAYNALLAASVFIQNPIDSWDDFTIYGRAREQLEANREAQKTIADNEKAVMDGLASEIYDLGNVREYRATAQPNYLLTIDDKPYYVTINSDRTVIVTPGNIIPPQPR